MVRIVVLASLVLGACGKPAPQRPYELDLTARLRGAPKAPPREPTPTPEPAPLLQPPRD